MPERKEKIMSAGLKKFLNRGGLVAIILGVIGIVAGGGDTSAALSTAGEVATIAGAALVLVREIFN